MPGFPSLRKTMENAYIFYGGEKREFKIPPEWNVLTFADFRGQETKRDTKALAVNCLEHPVGAPPLKERLTSSDRIAVLVEDTTRASPKGKILEVLLEELASVPISRDQITIVMALGTHRGLTAREFEKTFGKALLDNYRFINHDCLSQDLVPVAELETGRKVMINRTVHEATYRIGIGSIFPHPMNGFGGGGKILFPGVADLHAILDHHMQYCFHEGTGIGRLEGNLFYEQVCHVARSAKLDFVINSVLDQMDRVHDMVSGDPMKAHLKGIELSKKIISLPFDRQSDLTLITSFPYSEGPQIVKPLIPAAMVTKKRGCIILAADCKGNLPDAFVESFKRFHEKYGENLKGGVLEHYARRRLIMEEGAVDFNMALGLTLAIQHSFQIILVSRDISREKAEKMGFLYGDSLEDAFDMGSKIHPGPDVHIIPAGGVILPILENSNGCN